MRSSVESLGHAGAFAYPYPPDMDGATSWHLLRSSETKANGASAQSLWFLTLGHGDSSMTAEELWQRYRSGERDFRGIKLTDAFLRDVHLIGIDLSFADLRGASLMGVNLLGANLRRADFTGAFLIYAQLRHADLTQANLTDAWLTRANLQHACLINADLTRTDLTKANLHGATGYSASLLTQAIIAEMAPHEIPDLLLPRLRQEPLRPRFPIPWSRYWKPWRLNPKTNADRDAESINNGPPAIANLAKVTGRSPQQFK